MSTLFSPVNSREFCGYFYALEIIYFVLLVSSILAVVIGAFRIKLNASHYGMAFGGILFKFLMYAQTRLLYSMCYGN